MKNINLYTTATECIKNKFKFLFDMGYTIRSTNYNFNYFGYNALQVIFSNNIIYRKIEITLVDFTDISHSFIFMIYSTNDKDRCMLRFFDLIQYLVSKKIPYDVKLIMDLENYNGTDEERINQLLDYVCNILQKYLMPILSGKEWEEIDFMYGIR